jgi:hypothetical protein
MNATIPATHPSDFFNVLNRNVRTLIYSYMTLVPIRKHDAKHRIGSSATSREVKQETEEEGVRHLMAVRQALPGDIEGDRI